MAGRVEAKISACARWAVTSSDSTYSSPATYSVRNGSIRPTGHRRQGGGGGDSPGGGSAAATAPGRQRGLELDEYVVGPPGLERTHRGQRHGHAVQPENAIGEHGGGAGPGAAI